MIGSGSYEQYCTLGIFAYGGNDPCLSKASANKEACVALNHFLRSRFPGGTWTSLAVGSTLALACIETSYT